MQYVFMIKKYFHKIGINKKEIILYLEYDSYNNGGHFFIPNFINTKKELKIEENTLLKSSKILNSFNGATGRDRTRGRPGFAAQRSSNWATAAWKVMVFYTKII